MNGVRDTLPNFSPFNGFKRIDVPGLSPLAWCAAIRKGDPCVSVLAGNAVHSGSDLVFEGSWNGRLTESSPIDAFVVAGSGAAIREGNVVLITPTHTLERLHVLNVGDYLYASNSFALLLAAADDDILSDYRDYQWDFMTSLRGLGRFRDSVPSAAGNAVRLLYHCNAIVRPDLSCSVLPKPQPPDFDSYDEYLDLLRKTLTAIEANAVDHRRSHRFSFLATVSAGYDSPACAALLRERGCTEAITFIKARAGYRLDDDSGTPVGTQLGYNVHEFSRTDYMQLADYPEADFLASGMGGEEVVFAPAAELLRGRVLVTGFLGDTVWGLNPASVNEILRMTYPGGATFSEFRLRVGFIHLPLPFVGYIRHPRVFRISCSEEMAPWRLATGYDRPIPRRIAESHGVQRDMFGRTKMAISQPLWNVDDVTAVMTQDSAADLKRYADRHGLFTGAIDRIRFGIGRFAYKVNQALEWRLEERSARSKTAHKSRLIVAPKFGRDRDLASLTFHWAFSHVRRRYATALNSVTLDDH